MDLASKCSQVIILRIFTTRLQKESRYSSSFGTLFYKSTHLNLTYFWHTRSWGGEKKNHIVVKGSAAYHTHSSLIWFSWQKKKIATRVKEFKNSNKPKSVFSSLCSDELSDLCCRTVELDSFTCLSASSCAALRSQSVTFPSKCGPRALKSSFYFVSPEEGCLDLEKFITPSLLASHSSQRDTTQEANMNAILFTTSTGFLILLWAKRFMCKPLTGMMLFCAQLLNPTAKLRTNDFTTCFGN